MNPEQRCGVKKKIPPLVTVEKKKKEKKKPTESQGMLKTDYPAGGTRDH